MFLPYWPHRGSYSGSPVRLLSPAHMASLSTGPHVHTASDLQEDRDIKCLLVGFYMSQFQWQKKYQARTMVHQETKETSCCHIRESKDNHVLIK